MHTITLVHINVIIYITIINNVQKTKLTNFNSTHRRPTEWKLSIASAIKS